MEDVYYSETSRSDIGLIKLNVQLKDTPAHVMWLLAKTVSATIR